MTTLQLARVIANAVLAAPRRRHPDSTKDRATQAVIDVLHRRHVSFMTCDVGDDGIERAETPRRVR